MAHRAKISAADKIRLIKAYRAEEDYIDLADILGVNRSSAWNIVSCAMKGNDPDNVPEDRRARLQHRDSKISWTVDGQESVSGLFESSMANVVKT